MIGVIDKFEANYAVIVFEDNDKRSVPLSTIPYNAKEGDLIVFEGIKTYVKKNADNKKGG